MAGLRLGVLGGTFDPLHYGHLIAGEYCYEQLKLDRVLFVPAGDPWRKASREVTPAKHRLEMTRLGIAGNEHFQLDDREVLRDGPSYSVDTLRSLRQELSDLEALYLIVGEDALDDMPHWHDPEGIVDAATLAVVPRQGSADVKPAEGADIVRVAMPYVGLNSSELRDRVKQGLSLRYQVPEAVEDYIKQTRLYLD